MAGGHLACALGSRGPMVRAPGPGNPHRWLVPSHNSMGGHHAQPVHTPNSVAYRKHSPSCGKPSLRRLSRSLLVILVGNKECMILRIIFFLSL